MFDLFSRPYPYHLQQIETLVVEEVSQWIWDDVPQMRELVMSYLGRKGKHLRPLLLFIFIDLHSGRVERAYGPAAALEIYHTATLIYDDIQDNSEFRRGLPCAHITASTSTAMNLAAVVRTLMYHCIHRSPHLSVTEKLAVHQQLDCTATFVSLGQSIDIGWHEGWYNSYRDFPYERMIQWKSAALFRAAASIGTFLSGANMAMVKRAEEVGQQMGMLFQMVDDYLDVFGDAVLMRRPLYNDFREGKITYPVLCLLDQLTKQAPSGRADVVLQRLAKRDALEVNWQWLVDLMLEFRVDQLLQAQLIEKVRQLTLSIQQVGRNATVRDDLSAFLDLIMTPVTKKQKDEERKSQ